MSAEVTGAPAAEHIRRVRLPADRRTPAAARAVVRSVLAEAHLDDLLNEALLLTTELSTNAVVHAGTELDIEVVAGPTGLTVTVTDYEASPTESLTAGPRNSEVDISDVSERGRGLLLVDHFASRWGTTHLPTGKGVWFRLDRKDVPPAGSLPEAPAPTAGALTTLLQIAPEPHADDALADFAGHLLARVAELVGAAGGAVRLDRGEGGGSQLLARYGRQPRQGAELLRVPLNVNRPYSGSWSSTSRPPGTPGRSPR
ncbi:hypothetical protein Psuf_036070 [Phytohabitans suffuscus]|uniref:Histidine kinase/HSP90-like ATPase domain-containing protein n=1 Tax=Phytohabitans suffuscus TaxID=624315 RepID=A0A6F8YJI2_9ACTN|nr:hypothetical protein Psuf_036070 [Phytohabitans suffuscus]